METAVDNVQQWLNNLPLTYVLTAAITLLITFEYISGRRRRGLLSNLPSPSGQLPVLGHLLRMLSPGFTIQANAFREFSTLGRTFSKQGLFYLKLGPTDAVFMSRPEYFEQIMPASEYTEKAVAYNSLRPWLGTGLLVNSGKQWQRDRKLLTPAFHFKILEQFNPIMNKHAKILRDIVSEMGGHLDNASKVISVASLDTLCETSFGVDMELQTKGDNEYTKNFHTFCELASKRVLNPFLINDFIYAIMPDSRSSKTVLKKLHKFTDDLIVKRKAELIMLKAGDKTNENEPEKKKLLSLLDLMLDMHFSGLFSLLDIRSQLDTFAFAGYDSVSTAIVNTLVELAHDKQVLSKLHNEIDKVLDSEDAEITSEHLKDFKYLEMVIKENLRLHPAAPFVSRLLRSEVTIGGYTIPAGVDLWFNIQALHLSEDIFPNPKKFDPERFSDENSKGRHSFAYTPFSGGLRNCIGQRYAMNAMKIVLATLLKRFSVVPITKHEDIVHCFEITLKPMNPIAIKFEKRV